MTRSREPVCVIDPIGLNRQEAARYVGVSPGLFDRLVKEGAMPRARRAGSRLIWHTGELATALQNLPRDGESDSQDCGDIWNDVAK